ncbi:MULTISPECIES: hypothetical protein [Halobaculum]|uniref:Uncharacterized protein n=2 Tax=Halobaculum TaxID=43927 RepID=A0A8T8WI34_9EURY|nr:MULTISPECIES: hypothetical protein [Halobaculum]QZP39394.1 hypothetical protein K6T50_15935 [Halobaculum magnesiiphilum]QZY04208.1 hypothetical protein K6T36_15955 [Halobaculum roseum]
MPGESPPAPPEDAPAYVVDPLKRQPADLLRDIAAWSAELADHKTTTGLDGDYQEEFRRRVEAAGYSADPSDYEGVPDRAYISIKEPQDGYEYAYWQWRSEPDVDAPDRNQAIGSLDES